jgi:hypothetical protein
MLTSTARRVPAHTAEHVNAEIRQQTADNVQRVRQDGPAAARRRLDELDREWDIERYVETLAPSLTLLGLGLAVTVNRKWLALPFVVQAFFLQHALQGWCPPIPILRRLGVRTADEINDERNAIRGIA